MKKTAVVIAAVLLASCGPKETTDKQAQLKEYRDVVREYTEKIEALEAETGSEADIPENIRLTSVEVKDIHPEQFTSSFEAKGSVEALEDVYISPEISGQVKKVLVVRGAQVKKGDLLIQLNTEITRTAISEVKTSLELATLVYSKQKQLWDKEIGSEIQFLEARNSKEALEARLASLEAQLEMASIRAPFSGIVDDIMIKQGELASPGLRLLRLVNLEKMRITAQISESYLRSVKEGDQVVLSFSSYPDLQISERISRIGTVIDPITRTFKVEVLVNNVNKILKPNMLSSIIIREFSDDAALVVPSIILKQDFKGTFLFLLSEKGGIQYAKKSYVSAGRTVQDMTKITEGLEIGDQVIVVGYNLVSDGEAVSVKN